MGKINSKSTKAEMEAYIAELEAQLQNQKNISYGETEEDETPHPQYTRPLKEKTDDSVTLVYCSDSLGFAKISNMEFNFNRYGEQFKVPRYQFDELVGKYRRWFDEGILAVAPEDYEVAAAKGISTTDEFVLSYKVLSSIGTMSVSAIEELWNNTTKPEHRRSIITFVKKKFIEGDPKYRNREKIDLFNRLTNNGFVREQDELSGRYKYNPIEM